MTKFFKIIIILVLFGVFTYFTYPVIKNRYFNNSPSVSIAPDSLESNLATPQNPDNTTPPSNFNENSAEENAPASLEDSLSGKTTPIDPNAIVNINERGTKNSENLAHITTEHCTNNCNAFAMDFKLLEYCQQVCGLVPVKDVSNCDGKKDLEKDYCLKDLAITKKDSKLCNNIKDANIKLTCQNRILEDTIESQQKSEPAF